MLVIILNTHMQENITAISGLGAIVRETVQAHSWTIPEPVLSYTVRILASRVDRVPFTPEPSYAERFMQIKTPSEALEFGDTCFFTRSVFPELLERRGLKSSYFVELGQSSYTMVLKHSEIPHVKLLRDHFEFMAEVIHTSIRNTGYFRSMWA
jgi:hypothetical protein